MYVRPTTRVGDIIADKRPYRPNEQEDYGKVTVLEKRDDGVVIGRGEGFVTGRGRDDYEKMSYDELAEEVRAGNLSFIDRVEKEDAEVLL